MGIDQRLLLLVNLEWTCPALDWWSAIVTAQEIWLPPVLLAAGLAAWRGGPRLRAALLVALVTVAVGDGIVVRSLKAIVARPRPTEVLVGVRTIHLADVEPRVRALAMPLDIASSAPRPPPRKPRSMPSGHAWNCFALATLATLASPRRGWITFVPAALVGYARVYGGVHWPSDVVVSALLAPPFAVAMVLAFERLRKGLRPRLSARAAAAWPSLLPQAARQ